METTTKILDATGDDAATINGWSDCYPATIIKRTATTITLQRDRTANLSSTETIESGRAFAQGHGDLTAFTRDYDAPLEIYSLRKNGRWIKRGESLRGRALTLGHRRYYRDPSF